MASILSIIKDFDIKRRLVVDGIGVTAAKDCSLFRTSQAFKRFPCQTDRPSELGQGIVESLR